MRRSSLKKKPESMEEQVQLTMALHRYLNKTDQGYDELRAAVVAADRGDGDMEKLYELSRDFLEERQKSEKSDRESLRASIQLLAEISGALTFAGLQREGDVIEKCRLWLENASKSGSVREDEAFTCFAEAFAQIELHLQRSIIDPLDDTSHMLAYAEQRADELEEFAGDLSTGADVVVPRGDDIANQILAVAPDGVDAVADGSVQNELTLAAIRDGGAYASVRFWEPEPQRGITFCKTMVRDYDHRADLLETLAHQVDAGAVTLRVAATYPPEEAAEAHRRLEAGGTRGRLVIEF